MRSLALTFIFMLLPSSIVFARTAIPVSGNVASELKSCLIKSAEGSIPALFGNIILFSTDAASGKSEGSTASLVFLTKDTAGNKFKYFMVLELERGGSWQLFGKSGSLPGFESSENLKFIARIYRQDTSLENAALSDITNCLPLMTY